MYPCHTAFIENRKLNTENYNINKQLYVNDLLHLFE